MPAIMPAAHETKVRFIHTSLYRASLIERIAESMYQIVVRHKRRPISTRATGNATFRRLPVAATTPTLAPQFSPQTGKSAQKSAKIGVSPTAYRALKRLLRIYCY
jgi:hypothetical protein